MGGEALKRLRDEIDKALEGKLFSSFTSNLMLIEQLNP